MRKFFLLLLVSISFSFALEVPLPPYLKVVESTSFPPVIMQALLGDYAKNIERLEIVIVDGDKTEALQFWQQTLPSKGWRLLFSSSQPQQPFPIAYNRGKDVLLIAPGTKPSQLLLVEAGGVKDVGVLLGIIMKGLSSIATSLVEEEKGSFPKIAPFPQAKLVLEARIPAKAISEKLKGEGVKYSAPTHVGAASSEIAKSTPSASLLQSLLSNADEIHFREFQLPSKIDPREVINYYEEKLKKEGWQRIIKNTQPQPSFPYVLICAYKGDYCIISLIPQFPANTLHTLDEIILLAKKERKND
ncbi:hypothetical protein H5T88_04960 [bacterium]|nr:hypothetical protein [bacterium]